MSDRSDALREVSNVLGSQTAVLQMPGAGANDWQSPDGHVTVFADHVHNGIGVTAVGVYDGQRIGRCIGLITPENAVLLAAALAEKAAVLIAERRST